MIGYLKGKILLKGEDFLIVDVSGVGYKIFVSERTIKKFISGKKTLEFFVWPYLKRETIELYGCLTQKEFAVFEILEAMPGIGPKTALSLASFGSLEKLEKAIEQEDKELFEIRGIGKKRLQRLGIELTGKIKSFQKKKFSEKDETLTYLISLGFSKNQAQEALNQVPKQIKQTEQRVKQALKVLGRPR